MRQTANQCGEFVQSSVANMSK